MANQQLTIPSTHPVSKSLTSFSHRVFSIVLQVSTAKGFGMSTGVGCEIDADHVLARLCAGMSWRCSNALLNFSDAHYSLRGPFQQKHRFLKQS